MARNYSNSAILLILFAMGLMVTTGCTSLNLSALSLGEPEGYNYEPGELSIQPSASEQVYQAVKQARGRNAIVLQVTGDSTPVRVLPLPEGAKSVFVSDLLKQSGITRKLGSVEATLYRNSTDAIGGIPMEVKMASDGRSVRPESDYALRAGDRLQVSEAPSPAMKGMMNMLLGL
ncbi:MAG: hypothetical protein AB8B91_10195 [Rubripirellula sp.]